MQLLKIHLKCEWRGDLRTPTKRSGREWTGRMVVWGYRGSWSKDAACLKGSVSTRGWAVGRQRAGCPLCCHKVACYCGPQTTPSLLQTIPCTAAGVTLCRRKPNLEHLLQERPQRLPLVLKVCHQKLRKSLTESHAIVLYNRKSSTEIKGEEPTREMCSL